MLISCILRPAFLSCPQIFLRTSLKQAGTTCEVFSQRIRSRIISHSAYVNYFVTFATKVPYLTFCDKIWQFFIKEMDREGGNKDIMRKCREWISLHFLLLSLHFLFIYSFSLHFLAARLQGCSGLCNPEDDDDENDVDYDGQRGGVKASYSAMGWVQNDFNRERILMRNSESYFF